MQELNSSYETGTLPESIVRVAQAHGLKADMQSNLTLTDLEQFNANGTPVIIACQAWRDPEEENQSWDNLWDDGHYMVVIGLDKDNVYFEDPSLLGSRGYIPRQELLSRWHDYEGTSTLGPDSTVYYHLGIIIRGSEPATYPAFTYVG
jgi:predicted double-glycine peptidase